MSNDSSAADAPKRGSAAPAWTDSTVNLPLADSDPISHAATQLIRPSGAPDLRPAPVCRTDTQVETFPFLYPPVSEDEIGRLGNYRVLRLLGKGGMALVFLAEDIGLNRKVALKVMRPDLTRDPNCRDRFLREARFMASIRHDHLVTVFQVGQENDVVYLAMELLPGETVEQRINRDGPMNSTDVLRIGREIATGLSAIHRQQLIHRDVKPANLWLEAPGGRVKLLDFGLARPAQEEVGYTLTGTVVGTPGFMSPEQARGESVDMRSDLFSLGGVLYCLCTGKPPFHATSTMAILTKLIESAPTPPHEVNAAVTPALSDLVMRLLSKDPSGRPASAEDVIAHINLIESGAETVALPAAVSKPSAQSPTHYRGWIAVGVAAVAVIIAVGAVVMRPAHPAIAAEKGGGAGPRMGMTFLSDLTPFDTDGWIKAPPTPPDDQGEAGDVEPPRQPAAVRIQGRPSPHGLFMHPPMRPDGGLTRISFRLDGRFTEFHSDVSLNDGPLQCDTPLIFSIYGDDRLLWKSKPVSSQKDEQRCNIGVDKVQVLMLEVDCPGEPRGAHAVWVEPHLR